ncbi:MAG TPA: sterol desaturase family protein [Chitinophagaceae bacterium]|nr:sterol desaturase family protein [Chitinophagaceae bacterium]
MKTEIGDKNFLTIKYEKNGEYNVFMKTLRKRIDNYFSENKIQKYANGFVFFKITLILTIFLGSYALMISNRFSPAIDLLFGTICGLSTVLIVMNIGHDAAHNSLTKNKKVNSFMSWSIELAGTSHSLWKINHNIIQPIHPFALIIFMAYNVFVNPAGHGGFEFMPESFQKNRILKWQNSVTNHDMHHTNLKYNYGFYFTFWDKMMNTLADKKK